MKVCKHCGGIGWLGRYEQCPWCDGTGKGVYRYKGDCHAD